MPADTGTKPIDPAFSKHLQPLEATMKGILAWLIGIPLPIIILLYLFDVF